MYPAEDASIPTHHKMKNVMREILLSIYFYSFVNIVRLMERTKTNNFTLNYLMTILICHFRLLVNFDEGLFVVLSNQMLLV